MSPPVVTLLLLCAAFSLEAATIAFEDDARFLPRSSANEKAGDRGGSISDGNTANIFDFFFNRCLAPEDMPGDIGRCARDLLREALDEARPRFSSGISVLGTEGEIILDPLTAPDVRDKSKRPKWELTRQRLDGLQNVSLNSVLLTKSRAAVHVSVPALTLSAHMLVRYGFLTLRPHVTVDISQPGLIIGTEWRAVSDAADGNSSVHLFLEDVSVQLLVDTYNVTIKNAASMGKSLQTIMNNNSEAFIEFITPSLEAVMVRKLKATTQKQRHDTLQWLENIVS